jgi:cobalt/nickel transport protein
MKRGLMSVLLGVLLLAGFGKQGLCEKWPGVDEAVVSKVATEANRPPREPFIPLEGDALLFAFLMAGVVGGFVGGYYFRDLFPRRRSGD